jgi:hypothetical protein
MTSRLRYAFLFAVAATPLLAVRDLKPMPVVVLAAIFVLHAASCLVAGDAERSWLRDGLSAALWLGCFVAAGIFLATVVALALWPPVTPDGHPVMPIGQALLGIVAGGLAGLAVGVFGSLRHAERDRRRERRILVGLGALWVVASAVRLHFGR